MIVLYDFLEKNIKKNEIGSYAIVSYDNKTEAIWFTKYNLDNKIWFLEAPCDLRKELEIKKPVDIFCKEYVNDHIDIKKGCYQEYIDKFVKPMIYDGFLYEIDCPQVAPFLPKEVEKVELITEKECLHWILNNN